MTLAATSAWSCEGGIPCLSSAWSSAAPAVGRRFSPNRTVLGEASRRETEGLRACCALVHRAIEQRDACRAHPAVDCAVRGPAATTAASSSGLRSLGMVLESKIVIGMNSRLSHFGAPVLRRRARSRDNTGQTSCAALVDHATRHGCALEPADGRRHVAYPRGRCGRGRRQLWCISRHRLVDRYRPRSPVILQEASQSAGML